MSNIILLLKSENVTSNTRPRKNSALKFCHWNLNGLAAHKVTKLSLIKGYVNINDIGTIFLSETIFRYLLMTTC